MGNQSGKVQADDFPTRPHQDKFEELYVKLCDDEILSPPLFEDHFKAPDDRVTKNLFNQFFIDLVNNASETKYMFLERCHHILESTDSTHIHHVHFFFDLIANDVAELTSEDLNKIIHAYCAFGIHQVSIEDEVITAEESLEYDSTDKMISSIAKTMLNGKESVSRDEVVNWIHNNCPKMSCGLHTWLEHKFLGSISNSKLKMLPQPSECSSLNLLLTPSCLWLLCCVLPSCYTYMENKFKTDTEEQDYSEVKDDVKFTWNLLYDSNQHGLSLNRFKNKVMEYKSPTVTLIEFSSGVILMLALDEKWKDSPEKYGGHYCQLVELSPTFSVIEANPKMLYLKECGRSVPTGLLIGSDTKPKVKISTDLNAAELYYKHKLDEQVERMEVWGCGGVEALKSQQDIKKWEMKETEKRKKVKLPGQWDTDKSILEMGGVRVNHSERGDM